jgi:hypothetical protein
MKLKLSNITQIFFEITLSVFFLSGLISCTGNNVGYDEIIVDDIDHVSYSDFDEITIDLDKDGHSDLFGKVYHKEESDKNLDTDSLKETDFKLFGTLTAKNGWKILSRSIGDTIVSNIIGETWPVYQGEHIEKNVCEKSSLGLNYSCNESLAFTAVSNANNREKLLASGALASGKQQYIALMKDTNGQKEYAWIDISINPDLSLQWKDKDAGEMGFDYYCKTAIREIYYNPFKQNGIVAGVKD